MQDMKTGKEARYQRVDRLGSQGRLQEAAALLREMAGEYSDDRSFIQLGVTLSKLEDFAGAEQALESAAAVAPHSAEARYYLSVALYKEGDSLLKSGNRDGAAAKFHSAADAARQATELKPDYGLAHLYQGYALERLGRFTEAIDSFRAALRFRPEIVDVELALGEAAREERPTGRSACPSPTRLR